MMPLAFIGGAVVGAAGLLAAALYDDKRTEAQYSPLLKTPDKLEAGDVVSQLNAYFFKAQALYSKCNVTVAESGNLIFTPISLPGDNLVQRAINCLGTKMNGTCRKWRVGDLKNLKNETMKLYGRYQGVFLRANEILRSNGRTAVDLSPLAFQKIDFRINNSTENGEWDTDFEKLADAIRDFLDKSCAIAEEIIQSLDQSGCGQAAES